MFKLTQPEKDQVITICDHLKNLKYAKALPNAAAISAGAEELITTEKPEKSIHHVDSINILSIRPL